MRRGPGDQVWCVHGKMSYVSSGDLALDSCCKDQRKDLHTHMGRAVQGMSGHENHGS